MDHRWVRGVRGCARWAVCGGVLMAALPAVAQRVERAVDRGLSDARVAPSDAPLPKRSHRDEKSADRRAPGKSLPTDGDAKFERVNLCKLKPPPDYCKEIGGKP